MYPFSGEEGDEGEHKYMVIHFRPGYGRIFII